MKKILIGFLLVFSLMFLLASRSYALDFNLLNRVLPGLILASPTPAPSPTPTITPTPTENVVEPTITPTETPTPTENQPSPTITSIVSPTISPTPTTKELAQKDLVLSAVIGALIVIILASFWPKIKIFLHEKTKP